jgi:hypothetical protein
MPPNMDEYVAAKAAGEMHLPGKNASRHNHSTSPVTKIGNDQTVSLRQINNADPVPVILNALRSFSVPATDCETVSSQPESI